MEEIGAIYGQGRERLFELVAGLDPEEAETPVPACPAWTVRDVIAHMAGCCADVAAGNVEGVTTEAWADAQVRQRRDRTMAELVGEWSRIAGRLEKVAYRFPSRMGSLWVFDLTAHEHDVRGALARPGARDSPGLQTGLRLLVEGFDSRFTTWPSDHWRCGRLRHRGSSTAGHRRRSRRQRWRPRRSSSSGR